MELEQLNIKKTVDDVLIERFEVPHDKLVETALLKDDLKLDSLDFVDMMVVLEEKFGGTIPEFDFTAIKTLGDIYKLVAQIANQKNSNS